MKRISLVLFVVVAMVVIGSHYAARVGASNQRALITQAIDENHLVTLAGNTRPEANANNDRGGYPTHFR